MKKKSEKQVDRDVLIERFLACSPSPEDIAVVLQDEFRRGRTDPAKRLLACILRYRRMTPERLFSMDNSYLFARCDFALVLSWALKRADMTEGHFASLLDEAKTDDDREIIAKEALRRFESMGDRLCESLIRNTVPNHWLDAWNLLKERDALTTSLALRCLKIDDDSLREVAGKWLLEFHRVFPNGRSRPDFFDSPIEISGLVQVFTNVPSLQVEAANDILASRDLDEDALLLVASKLYKSEPSLGSKAVDKLLEHCAYRISALRAILELGPDARTHIRILRILLKAEWNDPSQLMSFQRYYPKVGTARGRLRKRVRELYSMRVSTSKSKPKKYQYLLDQILR